MSLESLSPCRLDRLASTLLNGFAGPVLLRTPRPRGSESGSEGSELYLLGDLDPFIALETIASNERLERAEVVAVVLEVTVHGLDGGGHLIAHLIDCYGNTFTEFRSRDGVPVHAHDAVGRVDDLCHALL